MLLLSTVEQGECHHRTVCAGDALAAADIGRIKLSGRSPIMHLPRNSTMDLAHRLYWRDRNTRSYQLRSLAEQPCVRNCICSVSAHSKL